MITYYCDGSQRNDIKQMGIGIVGFEYKGSFNFKLSNVNCRLNVYEIEAIIKTIEIALAHGDKKIRIVNDDKYLILTINKLLACKKVKSKGLMKKERFHYLMNLIEQHKIKVTLPHTVSDKENIKRCHDLSRNYLKVKEG